MCTAVKKEEEFQERKGREREERERERQREDACEERRAIRQNKGWLTRKKRMEKEADRRCVQ